MKFKLLLTFGLLILAFQFFGQMRNVKFGVSYSPILTYNYTYERAPASNSSAGIFAFIDLTNRFGIGIGGEYQSQNLNTIALWNCDLIGNVTLCKVDSKDKFDVVKLPFWGSLNLNNNQQSKIKTNLIGGYAFGKLLNADQKEEDYHLKDLVDNLHYGFIGVEFKGEIRNKIQLTVGPHLEFTNIYDKKYGEIQNLKLVIRISKL